MAIRDVCIQVEDSTWLMDAEDIELLINAIKYWTLDPNDDAEDEEIRSIEDMLSDYQPMLDSIVNKLQDIHETSLGESND